MSPSDVTDRTSSAGIDDDMTCVLDAAGVCLHANEAFVDAFAAREEDLIGTRVIDPALREILGALLERPCDDALAGEAVAAQRWWDFPFLGFRYVDVRVEPRRGDSGAIEGLAVRIRDLTDTRLAQAALENSERRFDDFAEVVGEGLWELDADLRFVYLSPQFETIVCVSSERVLGRHRKGLFAGEDPSAPATREHFRELDARRPFRDYCFTRALPDSSQRVIRMSGAPVFDANGRFQGYRGTAGDDTAHLRLEGRIAHLQRHDPLTGLVNRDDFLRRLERVVETAALDDSEHGLCYADVDRFRAINDRFGHAAGDRLLAGLAGQLLTQVRRRDTLARVAGNAFAILLEHCSLARIEQVAENVRRAAGEFRFAHSDETIELTLTIGVVPIDARSGSLDRVLRAADRACYAAKSAGGDRILVYGQPDRHAARERRRYSAETVP